MRKNRNPPRVRLKDCRLLDDRNQLAYQIGYRGETFWVPVEAVLAWEAGPDRWISVKHGGMKTNQGVRSLARQTLAQFLDPGKPGNVEIALWYAESQGINEFPGVELLGVRGG